MGIQSLEIKFSKIGVNQLSSNQDKIQKSVTYIPVLKIDDEYKVHNLDGELQGSIPSEKYGSLLQVNENSFILLKESTITFISDKGEIAGSRMLNEEELSAIK